MKEIVDVIHIVKRSHERLANYKILENNLKSLSANYKVHATIEDAISFAKSLDSDCVITGSFYIMSEARYNLGIEKKKFRRFLNGYCF